MFSRIVTKAIIISRCLAKTKQKVKLIREQKMKFFLIVAENEIFSNSKSNETDFCLMVIFFLF